MNPPIPALPFLQRRRVLIVTYNLTGPASMYQPLYSSLKSHGPWWHYIPTMWLIDSATAPEQVANQARPYMLPTDHMFVGTLQNGYNGWLPSEAWEWLHQHGISMIPNL